MINLDEPIVPGKSAAGITLGQRAEDIHDQPIRRESLHGCVRLDFDSVQLWIRNGLVDQIAVRDKYAGRLFGSIGIGCTLSQVQNAVGPLIEDNEDNLIVPGHPGFSLETEEWRGNALKDNLAAKITDIFVYAHTGAS